MNKALQAKHVADEDVLAAIDRTEKEHGRESFLWDLARELGIPEKVMMAKCASMIRRGLIYGCACGCRGDFGRPRFGKPDEPPRKL